MSTPVIAIREAPIRGPSHVSLPSYGSSPTSSLPPFSPPSAYVYAGSLGVAGASPPYRGGSSAAGDKSNPYLAAKKFWKRLCFDPALDPTEYTIGFIETVQQPERKSGVEAWSMRLHDRLLELPFNLFVERFCGAGSAEGPQNPRHASPGGAAWAGPVSTSDEAASDVPYHRIAYYKHGNVIVWESEHHKRRLSDLQAIPATLPYTTNGSSCGPSAASEGGGGAGPADRSGLSRALRRSSREGMPPMPPASPAALSSSLGGGTPPTSMLQCRGGTPGASGYAATGRVSARNVQGASPQGSDDGGLDGASSDDDGEILLLEEEEEEQEEEDDEGENEDGGSGEGDADGEAGPGSLERCFGPPVGRRGRASVGAAAAAAAAARGGVPCGPGGGAGAGSGPATRGSAEAETEPALPQLPEECWMAMLQQLGVRDVCMVGRTCRWLRQVASDPSVWRAQYEALWGAPPEAGMAPPVVRRLCRRSQLRAARWLEAQVQGTPMGFPSTTCLQMDDSKVVSADGNVVRLWSHATGRRIAALQGHPGRVTCVAFDDDLLVSGCTGAVVKLWDMDELRCRRTLRGHEGAVTCCCLLPTGIPVSGAEDGVMRLWDVGSGAAIVALEAGQPVADMQAHGPSGHLVAAAGWGIQLWDVSTATLLHTLGSTTTADDHTGQHNNNNNNAPAAAGGGGGAAASSSSQFPYTCVSYMGDLLAAGRQGEVVLMDPRVAAPIGRLRCEVSGGGGGGGVGAIAAAAGGGGGSSRGAASCVGVQMDEWKLVCGFNDGRHQLAVYDIRALPKAAAAASGGGGGRRGWQEPLMTLKAPARITSFQFHEQALLMGLEGRECIMWRFDKPTSSSDGTYLAGGPTAQAPQPPMAARSPSTGWARAGGASSTGMAGGAAGTGGLGAAGGGGIGLLDTGLGEGGGASGRKEKKKPAKVSKKQTRYPKRNTK